MVHKGRDYERFLWRDLCGELPQIGSYTPPRWAKWGTYGQSSALRILLNAAQPTSDECVRIDMDPRLEYHWDLTPLGGGYQDMFYSIEWDADARTVTADLSIEWHSGGAEATKMWTQPPQIHPVPPFSISMLWDTHTTSDAAKWDWGTGSVQTFLRIDEQGYPYP